MPMQKTSKNSGSQTQCFTSLYPNQALDTDPLFFGILFVSGNQFSFVNSDIIFYYSNVKLVDIVTKNLLR